MHRRPIAGLNYSAEGHFAAVRGAMPADVAVRTHVVGFRSTGVVRRLGAILDVARLRGDVVHITGDIHFVALGLRRARTVLTVLDCAMAETASPVARTIFRVVWLRLPVRRAARVVAISGFTADQLAHYAGLPRHRIEVVPVTIDDAFVPAPPHRRAGVPRVLCIGTTPNKNLEHSIAALTGLAVELHVIGPMNENLALRLDASGLVYRAEEALTAAQVRQRYTEADVVLFPSTYEGFGMPIVEAQATGRPVVTSDRLPMSEVAGKAACLVDPDDVASIRAGVERVLGDAAYREELIEKGLVNRERFRPAKAAEAYARIYREVAT